MFNLSGKLALVTGSSRGIGKAIALKLAEAGADIIVHCRSNEIQAQDTLEKIKKLGVNAYIVSCDTRNTEQINKLFNEIEKIHGRLDILVNNAATLSRFPFLDIPVEEWDRIMETNVRGYFLCSQRAGKMMAKKKWGRIINISSISQNIAATGRTHYCASKGAIGMLTKGIALELAPYNITANAVLPGSIHTDFNDDVLSDKCFYKQCVDGIPTGRIGVPDDIAGAVVMLSSDEASYINGACLTIDGGQTV